MQFPDGITTSIPYDPLDIQHVSTRAKKPVAIVEWNPDWPRRFEILAARIRDALGDRALSIGHVGSTSIPGLPAKDVIDIDIVVPDPTDEEAYVPALKAAGFRLLFREPKWYQHRFFGHVEPYANVHVFGPDCAEVIRHRLFCEWLLTHEEHRALYVRAKRAAATATRDADESVMEYNDRKEAVIREILGRVYRWHGLLKE